MRAPAIPFLTLALTLANGTAACSGSPEPPPLVLLISVDTLRSDRLGAYGAELGLTPRIDELALESELFEAAYAPASFTVPSISTILTGRYPQQNAITVNESMLSPAVTTLAEILGRAGFRTGAVVSNFVLRRGFGLEQGFERYDDHLLQTELARNIPERVAPETTRDALAMLDRLREGGAPVFLWVHYQDPHGPYTPPRELLDECLGRELEAPDGRVHLPFGKDHRGLDGIPTYQRIEDENEVGFYRASYDAEIRLADREIGRLLDGIRQRGLYERAVIVFVADHGEGLGEGGYWFAHGEYLSDRLIRVPLLVRIPGRRPGRRAEVVGLTDVLPTVLAAAGAPLKVATAGRDLLAPGASGAQSTVLLATLGGSSVPRFGLIDGGYKYVAELTARGELESEHLYRFGHEDEDLARREPRRTATMRARMSALQQRFAAEREERRRALDSGDVERMKKLGYAEGGNDH